MLFMMSIILGAAANVLFPPLVNVEYERPVWSNSTPFVGNNFCTFTPLTVATSTQAQLVLLGDNWTSIANKANISLLLLLRMNYVGAPVESLLLSAAPDIVILPDPTPGTYVNVKAPPALAPLCPCSLATYTVLSDDTMYCLDPNSAGQAPRILANSFLPGFITAQIDGSLTAFWAPSPTALVSDVLINLQVLSELFEVAVNLFPGSINVRSALPQTILLSVTTVNDTNSFAEALSLSEASWQPFLVLSTPLCSTLPVSPACVPLTATLSTDTLLPVNTAGYATVQGNFVRARVWRNPLLSAQIKVSSIQIAGRPVCNGHAASSWPAVANGPQVCQCEHFTQGPLCQQCQPMYNNKPWQQGVPCSPCECNAHASSCYYNQTLDPYPGSPSLGGGGVCINCQGFTYGNQCQSCIEGYFQGASLASDCRLCQCGSGSQPGSTCAKTTQGQITAGQCVCKQNVIGYNCDTCIATTFNLSASNPLGCQTCACNVAGSSSALCDQVTGNCSCLANTMGIKCDTCRSGYWDLSLSNSFGCKLCFAGAIANTFMYSDEQNTCRDCDSQCLQCTGPAATSCVQCRNYRLGNNTCVASCPPMYFADSNNVCQQCNSECDIGCSGMSNAVCKACKNYVVDATNSTGTIFNVCVSQCPELMFVELMTRRCLPCNNQCKIGCSGPLSTQCTACKNVSLDGICISECPAGDYVDSVGVCKSCNAQCADTCFGPSARECNNCLNFNNTLTNQCVASCPTTTYADYSNQCQPCDSECFSSCHGPGPLQCMTACTAAGCLPACKHVIASTPMGPKCVANCSVQSYVDSNNQCQSCSPVCDGCSGPGTTACTVCTKRDYLGDCIYNCPLGTYPNTPSSCAPCDSECVLGCSAGGPQSCAHCAHVNNSGTCQYSCPAFTYLQNSNCQACNSLCANGCSGPGPTECTNGICTGLKYLSTCVTSCPAGTLVQNNVCTPCPYGPYFLDNNSGNCSLCNGECAGGCSGPGPADCLSSCVHVAIIQNNVTVCIASCPAMTYAGFDKICHSCNAQCSVGCSGPTPSMCTSCANHYYDGQCIPTCPSGTHGANGINCAVCNVQCETCTGDGPLLCDQCVHARDPTLGCVATCAIDKWTVSLNNETVCVPCNTVPGLVLNNNICSSSCPAGDYVDSASVCQSCDSHCAAATPCYGPGPGNCTVCTFASLNGVCVDSCPITMYLDNSGMCQACNQQCVIAEGCSGPSARDCNQCAVYNYPANAPLGVACKSGQNCGQCVSVCPGLLTHGTCALSCSPFEYASSNGTCLACDSHCATGCTSDGPGACAGGLCRSNKLLTGQCVSDCPSKFVSVQGVCQPCDSQCLLGCTAQGPGACTSGACLNAYSLGVCVSQCPLGQYWRQTLTSTCQGYFCPDGASRQVCQGNTFQNVAGKSACIPCEGNMICVMNLNTGLFTSYTCAIGFFTSVNGTICGTAVTQTTTMPATAGSSTVFSSSEDTQVTGAVAGTLTVAVAVVVALAVFVMYRIRQRKQAVVGVSETEGKPRDLSRLNSMPIDDSYRENYRPSVVSSETYM